MADRRADIPSAAHGSGSALRRLLRELAAEDAAGLLAEARSGALLRAKAMLEDALVEELLSAATHEARGRQASTQGRASADQPSAPASDAVGGALWWAYCVLGAEDAAKGEAVPGIEQGSPVEVVVEGELGALVSRVPRAEYDDRQLREHLEDLDWLERTARAHEAVQEQVLEHSAIVPLRLCTLYRDREGVRRMLRENREELTANLARVAEAAEWGVKVFFEAGPATATAHDDQSGDGEGASGTAYLAGRQRERQAANELDELCTRCADEVHLALGALARAERLNPVQHPEAHGRRAEMILNGAYLVDRERGGELPGLMTRLAERWESRGFTIELTGPWPPYNFVSETAGIAS